MKESDFSKGLRIATFDIETCGLDAKYGYLLCVCVKSVLKDSMNGRIHTLRIDDPRNKNKESDKWLVMETKKLLDNFDLLITWNGSQFDFPFVNARALKHHLAFPVKKFRRDILFVSRGNFRIGSHRLKSVDEYANGRALKTFTTPKIHWDSIRGKKYALDFIAQHCALDVISTEKLYKKFIPILGKLKKGG